MYIVNIPYLTGKTFLNIIVTVHDCPKKKISKLDYIVNHMEEQHIIILLRYSIEKKKRKVTRKIPSFNYRAQG